MTEFKKNKLLSIVFFISLILSFALIFPAYVGAQSENTGDSAKVTYKTIPISMKMEAGAYQYKEWPGGKITIHAGIGWIEPFGRAEYVAGKGYPEAVKFPVPSYFNDEWMKVYNTDLFCIYKLKDGNIYAYDGIAGNVIPAENDDGRMDYLINVIVGGTGAYEGATGMLLGKTPGRGNSTKVSEGASLPVSILKLLEGYIKIPIKQ